MYHRVESSFESNSDEQDRIFEFGDISTNLNCNEFVLIALIAITNLSYSEFCFIFAFQASHLDECKNLKGAVR